MSWSKEQFSGIGIFVVTEHPVYWGTISQIFSQITNLHAPDSDSSIINVWCKIFTVFSAQYWIFTPILKLQGTQKYF
jgi:hypothetical protein